MSRNVLDVLAEYTAKGNLITVSHLPSIPAMQFTMERPVAPSMQVYRTQVCIHLRELAVSKNPEGMIEHYFKEMDHKITEQEEI